MSPARRSIKRRDWPRGLYEPRPGYYVWKHPDGRTLVIGRVPLAEARNEALAANQHVSQTRPGLVEQIVGTDKTVSDLVDRMEPALNRATARTNRARDKVVRAHLGTRPIGQITVKDCAEVIEAILLQGKARWAQSIRSRLVAVCQRGVELGWIDSNPAAVTRSRAPEVNRSRLTLETFQTIYAKAPEVNEWLQRAMMLALVSGQDRGTVVKMQRAHVADGFLTIWRGKTQRTNRPVAIPLALRMDAVGVSLADLVATRTGVISKYLLHHVTPWGNAQAGSPVWPNSVTESFTAARRLASVPDDRAPTFHEIRSLSKRLYDLQGNVNTKALLGHKSERMSDLYADGRGVEPIRVSIG